MKQLTLIALIAVLTVSASGCNNKKNSESQNDNKQQKTETMNNEKKSTLVAYFSASGVTKNVAEQIAAEAKGDIFEIKPEVAYTEEDLDWTNKQSRSSVEMNDKSSRPAIADKVEDMSQYDAIYLGFPIWWYTAPTIINTFMEQYDFTGKVIIPFATSGGSTIERAVKDLQQAYPQATWEQGMTNPSLDEIKQKVAER